MQERTGLSGLACALAVEFAGDVGGACRRQRQQLSILWARVPMPTLVVGRAARACKAHLAQVGAVAVAVAVDAPTRHGHGLTARVGAAVTVAVCARHSAARVLLSQGARRSGWVLRGARGVGGGRRVQLVGKGSVLQLLRLQLRRWWGQLWLFVVGRLVGLCARTVRGRGRGRKRCGHGHMPWRFTDTEK